MAKHQPRIGVVGVSDGWSSNRLADVVAERTGRRHLINLAHVNLDLAHERVTHGEDDLTAFDALIVKKLGRKYSPRLLDRLEVLHFLNDRGVRVFSRPLSIMRLLDRLACTVSLRLADIPMPDTVVTEDLDAAVAAVAEFGAAVLKPLFTSKARGMCIVKAGDDVREQIAGFQAAGNPVLYIQRKLALPGHDLGLAFLGGEYLACYARVAGGDSWNTTTHSGGKYRPHEPSREIIALAGRAQAVFDLDFTSVDIAETADGPVVFEVSAFGGFRGLREANGIDAASLYTDYVLGKLRDA